ncbi:MAG: glycosyltransferase, partial [Candidatus Eiseniibacteriota bacterium]
LVNVLVGVWVHLLLRAHGSRRPRVLYLSNVMCTPVASRLDRDLFLYDCNDDPLGFRTTPGWVAPYLDQTLAVADVVVSCSRSLARRLRARRDREVHVIGNGVEYEHFAAPIEAARLLPALRDTVAPRIGYAGAISNWFDFDLVERVALAHPERPVVLMGPVAPDVDARAHDLMERCPNVLLTGAVPYEDLAVQVASLTVAMIPFRPGGETEVLNPNKLYEYLAAGCTVVSRRYSEDVIAFEHVIRLADDDAAFVAAVTEALEHPFDGRALRAVARTHSWDARAAAMATLIRAGLGGDAGRRDAPPREEPA